MNENRLFIDDLNRAILDLVRNALRIVMRQPGMWLFVLKSMIRQKKAIGLRKKWGKRGVHVPPMLIFSVTDRCNLHCKGCYSRVHHRKKEGEAGAEVIRKVLAEAKDLGISIILLAGGEPLVRQELFTVTENYPEILFPMFTNGLLIDDRVLGEFRKQKHVFPVISLEGFESETDLRRGGGVYESILNRFERLKENNLFWGVSITVTSSNFGTVTDRKFLEKMTGYGCKIFFFVEYVPIQEETENMALSQNQRDMLSEILVQRRKDIKALCVSFPGDEEQYGGCLSAGRGFAHINPYGDLEPCPFIPFSDENVNTGNLHLALQSPFLEKIRMNHSMLKETSGGCALWSKREWVQTLLPIGKEAVL
jgi:MoaA/NifB/PqqE/SkfB family radical SAM enzyme